MHKTCNILVGCTGSVATLKLPLLVNELRSVLQCSDLFEIVNIRVVATEHSQHFFDTKEVHAEIFYDSNEWEAWTKRGDPVLHIDLSKWADIFLIAPLDANTLAKLANGLCDNLLTCIARAWNLEKPMVFCPAMNTKMYDHPLTSEQILKLTSWGYSHIPVIEKTLVCGDKGAGAMAEVPDIVARVKDILTCRNL